MTELQGIGKKSRDYLAQVLQGTSGIIASADVQEILNISSSQAGKYLHRWTKAGWVQRLKRGLYAPIPLDSSTSEIAIDDPWILAHSVFHPCYIGGWSAAEYWDFTEQVFSSVFVVTSKPFNHQKTKLAGIEFQVKQIKDTFFFGTKTIWKGKNKILVSDPSRTIVDMLNAPNMGGGIRPVIDVFKQYMSSEHRNLKDILEYAEKMENRTIFKRLGFILETYYPSEKAAIKSCLQKISKGYSMLDSSLTNDAIVTKWKLKVPSSWKTISHD